MISGDIVWSPGLQAVSNLAQKVGISIDGLMASIYLPILEQLCSKDEFDLADTGEIYFDSGYFLASEGMVRQTALLAETTITPELGGNLKYENVSFRLVDIGSGTGPIRLDIFFNGHLVTLAWLKDLTNILLDKRVILR